MIRVGVVGYVNALPLAEGLSDFLPGVDLRSGTPADIALDLGAGRLDVGLIPVAAFRPEWAVVPGLGIASRGPVRSVRLLARTSLDRVRRLVLDPASRTSNILARLWLGAHVPHEVTAEPGGPDVRHRLAHGDATVVIGEEALFLDPRLLEGTLDVDLGEAWTTLTGLPMVYAAWAGPAAGRPEIATALTRCYERNAGRLDALAARAAGPDAARRSLLGAYLASSIVYRLGAREATGLRRFQEMAQAAGLLPAGTETSHAALD